MAFTNMQTAISPLTAKIFATVRYFYDDFWSEYGDRRTFSYPFMSGGPWMVLCVVFAYVYFVKVLGPQIMRDRKPFEMRIPMVFYNLAMVIWSGWMFYQGCLLTNYGLDVWKCQPVNYSQYDPVSLRMIHVGWIFFFSKFVEFMDTIFFVLRKKQKQISFLHVLHHAIVPISVWVGLKFAPGGNNGLFPLINSFIHTVMYLYYGLSAFGPGLQRYLWWKKYLTKLQILQFIVVIVHGLRTLFMRDCQFAISFIVLSQFNAVLFLCLFCSFYRKSYAHKKVK